MATPSDRDTHALLGRAQNLCSRQEKCRHDIALKLRAWGASPEQAELILGRLLGERYIDHGRYALLFASEKRRYNRWGPVKIAHVLRGKGIEEEHIAHALRAAEGVEPSVTLVQILTQKQRSIRANSPNELRAKLTRFALGRGFPLGEVLAALDEVLARP